MSDIKSVIRARDELARIVGLREKELRELFETNDRNVKLYLEAKEKLVEIYPYAAHKPYCSWFEGFSSTKRVCDCGLKDILDKT